MLYIFRIKRVSPGSTIPVILDVWWYGIAARKELLSTADSLYRKGVQRSTWASSVTSKPCGGQFLVLPRRGWEPGFMASLHFLSFHSPNLSLTQFMAGQPGSQSHSLPRWREIPRSELGGWGKLQVRWGFVTRFDSSYTHKKFLLELCCCCYQCKSPSLDYLDGII